MAQSVMSARYPGMPHAAIESGRVDIVRSASELGAELSKIVKHPRMHLAEEMTAEPTELAADAQENLNKIAFLVRRGTGVDFSQYRRGLIEERIGRRLVLAGLESHDAYLRHLQEDPDEVDALFDDMLIQAPGFFREPEEFAALEEKVFPLIERDRDPDAPIRVWIPGCANGEEAYSIAIALLEYFGDDEPRPPIQILATTLSDAQVERARVGRFPASITHELGPERIRRFFVTVDDDLQAKKSLRELCVFARHNVAKDPPFSNLDLVSCKNLFASIGTALQERVIPILHHALEPGGFLLLGGSKTIGSAGHLFELIDGDHQIYLKRGSETRAPPPSPETAGAPVEAEVVAEPAAVAAVPSEVHLRGRDLRREADRVTLAACGPPGVIINSNMEILQFRGRIEEQEATNEELWAANEEIQSANEELQSTNEELETAREELQSSNEELVTLNSELETQNSESNRAIDDFVNLYSSVDIPVLLLDQDLRIRTVTAPAARQLDIREADRGRRIGELKLGIRFDGIEDEIRSVLATLDPFVREVESERGNWYSLRIRPYRTADDRITGAVMALVDITASREAREAPHNAMVVLERVIALMAEPVLALDAGLRVRNLSRGLRELLRLRAEVEARGVHLRDLGDGALGDPEPVFAIEELIGAGEHGEKRWNRATLAGGLGDYALRIESFHFEYAADDGLVIISVEGAA